MYAKGFYGSGNDEIRDSGRLNSTTSNSLSFCDFCSRIVKQLEKLFPYALSLGMTPEQYWSDEPELLDAYIEKQQYDIELENKKYHLLGQYFVAAVKEAMKTKKSEFAYPSKPFELSFRKKEPINEQEKIENDIRALFSQIKEQKGVR